MGNTSPGCYFLKASNNTFHDLTAGQSLPPAMATLLGLSLKFIPTPRYSPSKSNVAPSLNRIEWDIGLKTFFPGTTTTERSPSCKQNQSGNRPSCRGLLTSVSTPSSRTCRGYSVGYEASKTSLPINNNSWHLFKPTSPSLLRTRTRIWGRWELKSSTTSSWDWTTYLTHQRMSC